MLIIIKIKYLYLNYSYDRLICKNKANKFESNFIIIISHLHNFYLKD